MKIKKNDLTQLVNGLPSETTLKDMWDNPEKITGQGVRLNSLDANASEMSFHFERYGVEGFLPQFRPDWDITVTKDTIKADAELSAWYSIYENAVSVMSAILWQRKVNQPQVPTLPK